MPVPPRTVHWRIHAHCLDLDPNLFDLATYPAVDRDARAAELCAGCPVVRECAADAAHPLSVGVVRAGVWVPAITPQRGHRAAAYRSVFTSIARTGRPTPRPGMAGEGVRV